MCRSRLQKRAPGGQGRRQPPLPPPPPLPAAVRGRAGPQPSTDGASYSDSQPSTGARSRYGRTSRAAAPRFPKPTAAALQMAARWLTLPPASRRPTPTPSASGFRACPSARLHATTPGKVVVGSALVRSTVTDAAEFFSRAVLQVMCAALLALRYRHASRWHGASNLTLYIPTFGQAAGAVFPQRWQCRGHVHI